MDTERSHSHRSTSNNNSSTSELFVCFTSRLSSSSMKLSSKSILSPNRNRDPPQISLSSSLSRRLKSNGSMKGGQASPMFPTGGGKRRGVGFENPEPSSPKVTCIGQVRVKTKKQGKKMRSRSKRREASFRRGSGELGGNGNPDLTRQNSQSFQYQNHQSLQQECLKHRNQRWVHLPLTICEALREFSCFFPCRSSCMSSEREKEKGREGEGEGRGGGSGGGDEREGSCGFARWLVALQDGDGKGRRIELVMEHENEHEMEMEMDEEEDEREKGERSHSQRRHIFEDLDIDLVEGKEDGEVEEEKGRVSICIPPKNALLLMRCRSDPVKMAALANRFWESPLHKDQDNVGDENQVVEEDVDTESTGDEEEEQEENEGDNNKHIEMEQVEEPESETEQLVVESTTLEDDSFCERETQAHVVEEEEEGEAETVEQSKIENRVSQEFSEEAMEEKDENEHKVETFSCVLLSEEAHEDLGKPDIEEKGTKEKENDESRELSSSPETLEALEPENDEAKEEPETEEGSTEEEEEKETSPEKEEALTNQGSKSLQESTEREKESFEEQRKKQRETLPECLLLMMCEPKLSMEVSKETWVCSTDFIRYLPERPTGKPAAVAGGDKKVTVESSPSMPSKQKAKSKSKPPLMQPPRSSCSFPVTGGGSGMSMATMIEQKLMGSSKSRNGYEPFVLTRCKSEPMRSATKLAAPEACFWNNRKLEPHPPPASLGVGAPAGVGF